MPRAHTQGRLLYSRPKAGTNSEASAGGRILEIDRESDRAGTCTCGRGPPERNDLAKCAF